MQLPITPCLWFAGNADEAVEFYVSVLPNSRVGDKSFYGENAPLPAGEVMTIRFELNGRPFFAINGAPQFQFSPAISMMAYCDTQEELDRVWDALLEGGGQALQCGWLTDRYGLAWQIVPSILPELMVGDAAKSGRVMQALWGMVKLDIAALQRAAAGT